MKNRILSLICLVAAVGCASIEKPYTPDDLKADVSGIVQSVALVRISNDRSRESVWNRAAAGLDLLIRDKNWSIQDFSNSFFVAAPDRLSNQNVFLGIQAGVLAVSTVARGRINLDDPIWARAVIEGASDGIHSAIAMLPAPPPPAPSS